MKETLGQIHRPLLTCSVITIGRGSSGNGKTFCFGVVFFGIQYDFTKARNYLRVSRDLIF